MGTCLAVPCCIPASLVVGWVQVDPYHSLDIHHLDNRVHTFEGTDYRNEHNAAVASFAGDAVEPCTVAVAETVVLVEAEVGR